VTTRGRSEVRVAIKGDADFDAARKEIQQSFRLIERAADDTVDEIEDAFRRADVDIDVDTEELDTARRSFDDFADKLRRDGVDVDVDVDTDQIRAAFDLADQLDRITAEIDVEADIDDVRDAERLARSLQSFVARIDIDVEGRQELVDALGTAERLEGLKQVRLEVQGRQELERVQSLADDLERRRTIPVDARAEDLVQLDSDFAAAGGSAADAFSGGFDLADPGASALDGVLGALGSAGPYGAVAASVAAVFGDEFLDGFNASLSTRRDDLLRGLRTGLSDADLARAGQAAGDAWSGGFGESISSLADTAAIIQAELGQLDDSLDLSEATRQAQALSDIWGIEVADSIRLAQRLVANDLAPTTVDALNLIAQGAQDFGLQADDALDIFGEFAPVFNKLGIDGARAFEIVGRQIDEGLVTQVDRAAEQFEEFNIRITDGSAREAIEELGFSFDDIQERLASGDGASALAEIAAALAYSTTEAEATALAVDIFGASVESASDPERVFELLATADAIGEIGTVASDGADALEEARTSFDKLNEGVTELGGSIGQLTDTWLAFLQGDISRGTDQLADSFVRLFDAVTPENDIIDGWIDGLERASGETVGLEGVTGDLADGLLTADGQVRELAGSLPVTADEMASMGDEASTAAGGIEDVEQAIKDLKSELDSLFNFTPDQLFRDAADAAVDLAEAFAGVDVAAIGLNGQIDITTEGGAALQEQFENLNGVLVDAAIAYSEGQLTAAEFAAVQEAVTGTLEEVASQAGATGEQVDGLRGKYADLPPDVVTDLIAIDLASGNIEDVDALLEQLPDEVLTRLRAEGGEAQRIVDEFMKRNERLRLAVSFIGPTGSRIVTAGDLKMKAKGGPTRGLTVVGEEGPELVDFSGDAFVYTADQTRRILADGGDRAGSPVSGPVGSGRVINIEQVVTPPGRDLWQELMLAEQVFG
jgi:hypothetical protein